MLCGVYLKQVKRKNLLIKQKKQKRFNMKTKQDLQVFINKYNFNNRRRDFSKHEIINMSDDDFECYVAIATHNFGRSITDSLDNAALHCSTKESIAKAKQLFVGIDPEKSRI